MVDKKNSVFYSIDELKKLLAEKDADNCKALKEKG